MEKQKVMTAAGAPMPARQVRAGDLVAYVLPSGHSTGQTRPALVVRVWGTLAPAQTPPVNLQVFTDGTNDFSHSQPGALTGLIWATSVPYDQAEQRPGTWHWPEEEG
jgi:hypothetical protein